MAAYCLSASPYTEQRINTRDWDYAAEEDKDDEDDWFYDLAIIPFRIFRKIFILPKKPVLVAEDYYNIDKPILGPEILEALQGEYGSATCLSPDKLSVTL